MAAVMTKTENLAVWAYS